jgi:hypothetical protein
VSGRVTASGGGGGGRGNSRAGGVAGLAGVARLAASRARNLDGRVLNGGEDRGVALGDGSHRLRRNTLGSLRNGSSGNNGLVAGLSRRVGVDRNSAVVVGSGLGRLSGVGRLSGSSGLRRLLVDRLAGLLIHGLSLSRLAGLGLLVDGLGRLLRLLRLSGLAGLTDGADGGGNSIGLGGDNGGASRAVGDLGTARGDGLDVGAVDGGGGQRNLSGLGSLRGRLGGLVGGDGSLVGRDGSLGGLDNGVRGGADDGGSSRAVSDLRTARGDGDELSLVDNVLGGHGRRGQESGSNSVTHLESVDG